MVSAELQSSRRQVLSALSAAGIASLAPGRLLAAPPTDAFPGKRSMGLLRDRPPLLETPFEVFDQTLLTPNDRFYVRWHWSNFPTTVDADGFRLNVHGSVNQTLSLSLKDLLSLPQVEMVAVNQCAGNSRSLANPRVPGAQWVNGSMGNARWTGFRLKDLLDRAGVRAGAVQVRFNGLDKAAVPDGPDFMKSLSVDHARDGEVMVAYAMNGEQLPLLNGFPLRLIVPGWYATYWVKMLDDIEVLDAPDDNFWMTKAYLIPDTPGATMTPGQPGVTMIPINRMNPRSFFTNAPKPGAPGAPVVLRGIAFGGVSGVAKVEVSLDDGAQWRPAKLGEDLGKYSFRRWDLTVRGASAAKTALVRCTNADGQTQPMTPIWNPSGYMQNAIERLPLAAA